MQTENKTRFKEKVPCTTKNYIGKPYVKAISIEGVEGKESEVYRLEVTNSGKIEVSSLDLMNGTVTTIKVFEDDIER